VTTLTTEAPRLMPPRHTADDPPAPARQAAPLPPRHSVFGVGVSATDYDQAVACIIAAGKARRPLLVTAFAAHGVVTASGDDAFRAMIDAFDLVTPDGQPVRHALNILHRAGLSDRVYGPTMTLKACEAAAREGVSVYLYGSTNDTVTRLGDALERMFPGIKIAGAEPSLFRPLTEQEDRDLVERIEASGAGIVLVGLGCPRQEKFVYDHRDSINAAMLAVGAAFDFHAGTKKQAPAWMQKWALEWLFRLSQEPRRLLRRYAVTNGLFLWKFALQVSGFRRYPWAGQTAGQKAG